MQRGDILLVDTCVIIEAHRVGCWNAISKNFRLETVEMCMIEAQTGQAQRIHPPVTDEQLRAAFSEVYEVSDLERAQFATDGPDDAPDLDAGELDLWIHALQREDVWYLCGPDTASMQFGCLVGKQNQLEALETVLSIIGMTKPLKQHYEAKWLNNLKYKQLNGIL